MTERIAYYEEHIAPLLDRLNKACVDGDVPYLFQCQIGHERTGDGIPKPGFLVRAAKFAHSCYLPGWCSPILDIAHAVLRGEGVSAEMPLPTPAIDLTDPRNNQ